LISACAAGLTTTAPRIAEANTSGRISASDQCFKVQANLTVHFLQVKCFLSGC
jgi:hypothetical protein